MILISNIVLEVLDGSTVPSTDIYGADKKAYINIGSGNVFNLKWTTTLTGADTVNYYTLVIKRFDPTLNVYYDIFDKNIGLVNYFSVDSSILPVLPEQYLLHIYVIVRSITGSVITSNIVSPYVCKGSGTYVNVKPEGYTQAIMKRAIAFVNTEQLSIMATAGLNNELAQILLDSNGYTLITNESNILAASSSKTTVIVKNSDGEEVSILTEDNNPVTIIATRLLTSADWQLAPESFIKDPDGTWRATDIKYEVLVSKNEKTGNIEPIEVLNNEGTYELLYTL